MRRTQREHSNPVDSLRGAPDDAKERIWDAMDGLHKAQIWALEPRERRALLPKKFRERMSRCCCEVIIGQAVMEAMSPNSTNQRKVGKVVICSKCWKPQNGVEFLEGTPKGWGMAIWKLMTSKETLTEKFTFTRIKDGRLATFLGETPE